MELKNKVAIVTGASKGIGLELCRQLLAAGMKVAGWSRSEPDLKQDNFFWQQCDVGNMESVQQAFSASLEHFGADIAVLANNAGLGYEGKLDEMDPAQWHTMIDVNVNGIFYCTRLVLPLMKERGEGHIINLSSIAGTTGIAGMSGYVASKHAVRGISHSLYKEVRNEGIKVTCIYPGSTNTHFFDEIGSVTAHEHMMRPQDVADTILHCIKTHKNFHIVDVEMRPLKPKG
ncbi:SDR family oxidoreductase [Cesiribacter sp. SM1]|uniref:SDR family oxidoreductase n=1 Tax=Cesiribacter sp. SM1 TaxID=2861196 RepID=UPI001CD735A1|nr:SDR family NAD(P)-dependent oxidoreductase [Cesiribacter sp. SM1]